MANFYADKMVRKLLKNPLDDAGLSRLQGFVPTVTEGVLPRRLRSITTVAEAAHRAREIISSRGMWRRAHGAPRVLQELAGCLAMVISGDAKKGRHREAPTPPE